MRIKFCWLLASLFFLPYESISQCCGGGGGNPFAGDVAHGVLGQNQFEINSSFQFVRTNKFLSGNKPADNFSDNFNSKYLYNKIGYGLSERLTLSVEFSYWLNKTQVNLNNSQTISSSGLGDIIIMPRYKVYSNSELPLFTEITVGMGVKLPLGKHNDSLAYLEPFSGTYYYLQKPLSVQQSSGSQDFLVSFSATRKYHRKNLSLVFNGLYIKRGWNSMGEKMGNFAAISFILGKSFAPSWSVAMKLRGELLNTMKLNEDIRTYSFPNYDPEATGFKKVFLSPIISFNLAERFRFFTIVDLPVFQYMNKTQISSQHQLTFGLSYGFSLNENTK